MKFYGIYKITNLVNGKMYIGKHVTSNLDDGYMGSGLVIKRAVEKYGTESFRKEWLMFCEDEEELGYMERVFVDQTWVGRSDTYNLKLGGEGGWDYINKNRLSVPGANKGMKWTNEQKRRLSRAMKGKNSGKAPWNKGKTGVYTDEQLAKMAESSKGKKHSVQTKRRISDAVKGDRNPMFGKSAWKGRKHSEETRARMRASALLRWKNAKEMKNGLDTINA